MKSLHNLINKTTRAAMQQDSQMKQVISRIVPSTSMAHINFCRLEAGRLRITVDNASWIAKLRFSERQIVGALREARMDVVTLSFHVAPAETPVSCATPPAMDRSSNKAALALLALAESTARAHNEEAGIADPPPLPDAGDQPSTAGDNAESDDTVKDGGNTAQPDARTTHSVVRPADDSLRQELLKLAARLREEP
ncbi:DciA family protein [Granulosicoccus sp. 3-233]|uniref:DciA family protein n=1 Tax=Granulosicoccus sp. 3-233 TaxID=3417969 RepID=UPI003D3335CE